MKTFLNRKDVFALLSIGFCSLTYRLALLLALLCYIIWLI